MRLMAVSLAFVFRTLHLTAVKRESVTCSYCGGESPVRTPYCIRCGASRKSEVHENRFLIFMILGGLGLLFGLIFIAFTYLCC